MLPRMYQLLALELPTGTAVIGTRGKDAVYPICPEAQSSFW